MTTRDLITFPENKTKSEYESQSDLLLAIEFSKLGTNLEIAKTLLENYGNIDKQDKESRTLLVNSLLLNPEYVDTEIIKYIILVKGANINKLTNPYKNEMNKIVEKDTECFIECINNLINERYAKYVPLILAARRNYNDVINILLERGCNVDEKDYYDDNLLSIACSYNKTELVKIALNYKANIDVTILKKAFSNRHIESLKLLLNSDAFICSNKYGDLFEKAIIMDMDLNNNCELTKLFLLKEAKIEILDDKGFYALRVAIEKNHYNMVCLLIQNGIDINYTRAGSYSPFERIINESRDDSHLKIFKLMLSKGMKLDSKTALHIINPNNRKIIKLLKEEPQDLLNKAIQSKNINMIKILIKKEDNSEKTLIEIIKLNNQDLVKFYFENVKPLTTLNFVLKKIMDEVIDYDMLKLISENLK